jgi:hypothetical protein
MAESNNPIRENSAIEGVMSNNPKKIRISATKFMVEGKPKLASENRKKRS